MFSLLSRGYGTWKGIAKLEKPDSALSVSDQRVIKTSQFCERLLLWVLLLKEFATKHLDISEYIETWWRHDSEGNVDTEFPQRNALVRI